MVNVIKLRRGLNVNLIGKATREKIKLSEDNGLFGFMPDDFVGVIPKVVVHIGDQVKAGDALFVNKFFPEVKFSSPVSGTVMDVVR